MKFIKVGDEIINLEKVTRCFYNGSTLKIFFNGSPSLFFYENKAKWLWEKLEAACVYDFEQDVETIKELEND